MTPSFFVIRNTSFALSTPGDIRIDTHSRAIDANGELFWDPYVIDLRSSSYFAHRQARGRVRIQTIPLDARRGPHLTSETPFGFRRARKRANRPYAPFTISSRLIASPG